MFTKGLVVALLSVSVLGNQVYQNVEHDFGAMLARGEAMLEKRQGYYPTTRLCGSGKTCVEACGAGTEQCPASKSGLYCYEPGRSRCCKDGSGNSCRIGYYCTTDGRASPRTYCCPDGVDLGACAKSYSLTYSLISAASTFVPSSSIGSVSGSATRSATRSATTIPSSIAPTPTAVSPSFILPTGSVTPIPPENGSVTTSSPPVQFTAAGARVQGAAMAAVAGIAGFVGLL